MHNHKQRNPSRTRRRFGKGLRGSGHFVRKRLCGAWLRNQGSDPWKPPFRPQGAPWSMKRTQMLGERNPKKSAYGASCLLWRAPPGTTGSADFSTSELQKVLRHRQFLSIFTSKCAFRHSDMHFFDIRTSKSAPTPSVFQHFHFQMCFSHLFATAACNFSTSELQQVLRHRQFLSIFTSKCAFRHSGVQFFDIWTSKSGPTPSVFEHFHFQMCFSPQRRAIFRHLNFKKWSDTVSLWAFSLPNVLFATAACNFWCLLSASTSAPAALTGLLFDWPDTRIIEKTQHFATSLTFGADVSSFFGLSR